MINKHYESKLDNATLTLETILYRNKEDVG